MSSIESDAPQRLTALERFYAAFSKMFFRAIWPKGVSFGDMEPPEGKSIAVGYGEHWMFAPELRRLNRLGYSIYFSAQDPGGAVLRNEKIPFLRVTYQDAEPGKCADPAKEIEICGQEAHFTIQTSPGRFQRFFLQEDIPADLWPIIHRRIVEWHGHDDGCKTGPAQLMRAPGYRNAKYDSAPVVAIVHDRSELPRLTLAQITKYMAVFDPDAPRDPNSTNADKAYERVRIAGTRFIQPQEFASILARLDPHDSLPEWLPVIAAIKRTIADEFLARQVAEEWSKDSPRYKPQQFESHWRSINDNRDKLATYSTLKKRSKEQRARAGVQESEAAAAREAAILALLPAEPLEICIYSFKRQDDLSELGASLPVERSNDETLPLDAARHKTYPYAGGRLVARP